jgi:adenylosuccinate synthase
MGAAIAAIIAGLITIGTTVGTGVAKKKQTQRAQKEARGLYNQQTADQQKQQNIDNSLARRSLRMNEKQLSFQEKMFDEQSKDTEAQLKSEIGKANTQFQNQAADKLFTNPEESYLFKSRISGRYR